MSRERGPRVGDRRRRALILTILQYLYSLPSGAVRDTVPNQPVNPVPGTDGQFVLHYTGSLFAETIGADTSLRSSAGWDEMTGVGTPLAPGFVAALG